MKQEPVPVVPGGSGGSPVVESGTVILEMKNGKYESLSDVDILK